MLTAITARIAATPCTYNNYWLRQLHKFEANSKRLAPLCEQINQHLDNLTHRIELMARIQFVYPPELPVSQEVVRLKETIAANQLTIICGETGSGKTTQLPKILLELGYAKTGLIGHTQPRRIAARSLANRISQELGSSGDSQNNLVGYKMRFHDRTGKATAIKLMTDGILLQEIQLDKQLLAYSALIIDEVHERSLNIDFILGYLKELLPKRPDLKVIITSATLENDKLSSFFNQAPIVNVSGKTYPVDIIYQDFSSSDDESDLNLAIYKAINAALSVDSGNGLVFLPGEREIKHCLNFLRKTELNAYELLPLFARQNNEAQSLIFNNNGRLKIILATNIAETSLTIPGIKFVIDSGLARIKRYSIRNRVEQLQVEAISQASSKQRAGRAGRVSHGMCIRLFSEDEFNFRRAFTEPELLRSNLANVILRLMSLDLGDPAQFQFLDQPESKAFNDGFKTLFQVGAIDEHNQITSLGHKLARLPLDVQLARVLIAAGEKYQVLAEILIIVSFLAIQDPREVPLEQQQLARERHSLWVDKQSEFLQILNLWRWYHEQLHHKKSNKKLLEICHKQFVSLIRLREWHELYCQLKETMLSFGYQENTLPATYQQLHQAILSGFVMNIGQKDSVENYYLSTNGRKYWLHPSSQLNQGKWLTAVNLVDTTRLYARYCAVVEPQWLNGIAEHLFKYVYSGECWDAKRGEVTATKSALLYGLLIKQHKVSYGSVDPIIAQEIMIKEALVANRLKQSYPFIDHNSRVIAEVAKLEDKLRTSLALIDEELYNFYKAQLPPEVVDVVTLERFLAIDSERLKIDREQFISDLNLNQEQLNLYPDKLIVNGEELAVRYVFDHDSSEDGMVVLIKLEQLGLIQADIFSYLVPGLIRDKITYLIKMLPKNQRLQFNPVQESVSEFLEVAKPDNNLLTQFILYAKKYKKLELNTLELMAIKFPTQFTCHFRVTDKRQVVASGDDLELIKQELRPLLSKIIVKHSGEHAIKNLTGFIPELVSLTGPVELVRNGRNLKGYASLVIDSNRQINYEIVADLLQARRSTQRGLIELIKLQLKEQQKYLNANKISNFTAIALALRDIYTKDELANTCVNYVLNQLIMMELGSQFSLNQAQFDTMVATTKAKLGSYLLEFGTCLNKIGEFYQQIKLKLNGHPLTEDIYLQLDDLLYSQFLSYTKWEFLRNFPRYLQAILIRLDRYQKSIHRDQEFCDQINQVYDKWYDLVEELEHKHKQIDSALYDFKYKIEELRISLFAQEIRTLYPVSAKRLLAELQAFRA